MAEKDKNVDEDDLDLATEGKKKGLGALLNKQVLMIAGGAILLIAISIGATLMLVGGKSGGDASMESDTQEEVADKADNGKEKTKKKKGEAGKEPVYVKIEPAFVVNFTDKTGIRYLQASIEVLVTDPTVEDEIKKHMPLIRNNLLLLLGSQTTDVITTREGKQRLRNDVLKEMQKVLKEKTGQPGVEAVYFTSFVVQ